MKSILISVISIFITFSAIAQNSADLKLNLEKNKVYRLKSTSESNITQTVNGMTQSIQSNSSSVISFKAADIKPDFFIAEIRFDTINSITKTMGNTIVINSMDEGNLKSKEASEVLSFFTNRMTKNPLFAKMDYTGKLMEIVNIKMYSDIVLKDVDSVNIDGPAAPMITKQIKNMANENALKTMASMLNYLPGKKIAVGEKWEISTPLYANGMKFNIVSSYKLESIAKNMADVSAESTIIPAGSEPMDMGGVKINYSELKGLMKSTFVIDIKTGLITESSGKSQMSGNLAVDVPGQTIQIPMDVKSETKVIAIK